MTSLRRNQKTHTVPPNTDRFYGTDTSQEIETATEVGCKHTECLMSRPAATAQLLVQTLLYQWHSDFRTLILTVPIQCAKTGQQIHPQQQTKRTQPTDSICIAVFFCRKAIVTHANGTAALQINEKTYAIAVCTLSKQGPVEQYLLVGYQKTSNTPHP